MADKEQAKSSRAPLSLRYVGSNSESSNIADVLDELRGIPEREAGGEQLDARVAELIDELEEHMAKLEEEKARLLHMAVAFGPIRTSWEGPT